MSRVILDMSMSLDGIVAIPDDFRLHEWYFNPDSSSADVIADSINSTGAIVMGRRTYDVGDQTDGFVDNAYQVPHFVLSRGIPDIPAKGSTQFTFVTDGIESALAQAKAAAGERDVVVGGGANTARQFLNAGLVDEVCIHLVPVVYGAGLRLFDQTRVDLERASVIESSGVTHLRFRVVK